MNVIWTEYISICIYYFYIYEHNVKYLQYEWWHYQYSNLYICTVWMHSPTLYMFDVLIIPLFLSEKKTFSPVDST